MKTNFENFTSLGDNELMETNGGGFAHDMGRLIRFIGLALPLDAPSLAYAISDWQINEMING
ncbi:MAG: hypothetical protein QNK35_12115 [Bacteroides sp.]|nr:hypothetical protein [Bacteroides sp.]